MMTFKGAVLIWDGKLPLVYTDLTKKLLAGQKQEQSKAHQRRSHSVWG